MSVPVRRAASAALPSLVGDAFALSTSLASCACGVDVNGPEMVVAMAMPAVLTLRFFFAGVVLLQAVLPHKPVIHPSTGNVRAIKAILMFREYPPIENRKGSQNGSSQIEV